MSLFLLFSHKKNPKHAIPKQNCITHRILFQEIYLECKCFGLLFSSKFGENACLKEYETLLFGRFQDVLLQCRKLSFFFKGCFVILFLEIRTNIGPSDD